MNTKLSVIIPVYNAEIFIEDCLNSIINQTDERTEIIIVNDGSTDRTDEICKIYKEKENIKYIYKQNEGVSVARNVGINAASGEWITFIDADDRFQDNSLSQLKDFECDADVILFDYSNELKTNQKISMDGTEYSPETMMKSILNYTRYNEIIKKQGYKINSVNNWVCWGKFFRRSIIVDNNISFTKGITHGEDLIFCYEVYNNSKKVKYLPIVLYYYYTNTASVSRTYNKNRIINTKKLYEKFIEFDSKLKQDHDFCHFVVERLLACCVMYFGNSENTESKKKKESELKELVEVDYINKAIKQCFNDRLSTGKKRNIIYKIILWCLVNKRYRAAIGLSKIIK